MILFEKHSGTSFRSDRNKHGGGILLHVWNNINVILPTDHALTNDIEAFFIEIKVNKYLHMAGMLFI